jgi:hypothetical protein
MVNHGVDLFVVGKVLGHKDPRSTKRYAHLETESLRGALETIGTARKRTRTQPEAPKTKPPDGG